MEGQQYGKRKHIDICCSFCYNIRVMDNRNPQIPLDTPRVDISSLNAELMDPNTSHERVEEILAMTQGVPEQPQEAGTYVPTEDDVWGKYTDDQLASMLTNSRIDTKLKDEIANYVHRRGQQAPTGE